MANADSTGSAADIPSFRYRVSGMDCAKDAAQIERAAQSAGIAPDAVKVSTATHIMTLTAPEARLPEIEKAVETTGYGFDRIESDEDLQQSAAHQDPGYRRALWIVVILNVGYGVLEMIGGFIAGSQAVKADALDFIGDGAITFLGLLAIGWSLAWRARSALIQGIFLGLLGLGVFGTTIVRAFEPTTPDATLMGILGLKLALDSPQITLLWAPSGIALAFLLRWGRNYWPAVWLGAMVVNVYVGSSVLVSLARTICVFTVSKSASN